MAVFTIGEYVFVTPEDDSPETRIINANMQEVTKGMADASPEMIEEWARQLRARGVELHKPKDENPCLH